MGTDPILSQVSIFAFNYAPQGWALCNGQLLSIFQNQALFSLLGTTYGGDGITTFRLPDLRGRVAMHTGINFNLGQTGGEQSHSVIITEMPQHTHTVIASSNSPNIVSPSNDFFASNTGFTPYGNSSNEQLDASSMQAYSGGQPHENMSPYLTMNFCIALVGIYPSRN